MTILNEAEQQVALEGNKIRAIKSVQERTGIRLVEAKTAVEDFLDHAETEVKNLREKVNTLSRHNDLLRNEVNQLEILNGKKDYLIEFLKEMLRR